MSDSVGYCVPVRRLAGVLTDTKLLFTDEFGLFVRRPRCKRLGCRVPAWWSQTGSNRRPPACKAGALPTELWPRASQHEPSRSEDWHANRSSRQPAPPAFAKATAGNLHSLRERRLVGLGRFELPTSRLSSARSNQLSYKPGPGVGNQQQQSAALAV
jgi:hypothetical protein